MRLVDLPFIGRLFGGIPGPFFAKNSLLWTLYHLLRGSYRNAVQSLHRRYSTGIIQVGPKHVHLADKRYAYISKLVKSSYLAEAAAHNVLTQTFAMESIFKIEAAVDGCNRDLISLLPDLLQAEGVHQLPPLILRYAWEVVLLTTSGARAGFLERDINAGKIETTLKNWKFYSILYGSYLRYHPFITRVIKAFVRHDHILQVENIEARVALCLSVADPAITLITTALQYIYNHPGDLLARLRSELSKANIDDSATFKALILSRPQLPLLFAVLQECARFSPPRLIDPTFTAPAGGVDVGDVHVPPDHLISIGHTSPTSNEESSDGDSDYWDIEKWLDPHTAASMKRQLLAFNLSASDNLEQFQVLLAAKLIVQIIVRSDNSSGPENDHETNDANPTASRSTADNATRTTLAAADAFTAWLSKEDAEAILTGRLAPHHDSFTDEAPIFTRPIWNNYDRALMHEAIRSTHGERLAHYTHPESQIMCIGSHSKIPREYRQKKQRGARYGGNRGIRQHRNAPRAPLPPHTDSRTKNWGNWAQQEGARQDHSKTQDGYRERQEKLKQREDEAKKNGTATAPEYKFKETFKQTSMETVNGKLGGVRKVISPEQAGGVKIENMEVKERPKAVPPHLRRRHVAPENQAN